jgi:hypothetical protein
MDERHSLRIQEEVEREFRNKERAAMRKKKDDDVAMRKAREEQVRELHKCKCYRNFSTQPHFVLGGGGAA